jgi:hypothetical protein
MNTPQSQPLAAFAAITHDEAKVVFQRLCAKAKRTHSGDGADARTLFSAVCALRDEWEFGQGFPLGDLKHLALGERTDFLALLGLILTADYYPSFFARVIDETLGEL